MTCREKLKIEYPSEVGSGFIGGCCGCPHHFGYLDRPHYCAAGIEKDAVRCTMCWDREIPGTEETKEKNMELNEKFAKMTFAELVDTAASYEKKNEGLQDTIDIIEREKTSRIRELHEKIENLKDIIESKNGLIGTLKQKVNNTEKDVRIANKKNKGLVDVIDTKKARIIELSDKNESLKKDITFYRNEIDKRNQRLDEKEAKILNMQDTIDFQERHINRIEGELKLYKGMKVDTNKKDYTKPEKVEPLCKYIPSNRVIGTLESAIIEEEGIRATILLTEEAAECFMPNGRLPNLGSDIKVGDFAEPTKLRTMPDIDEMHTYTAKIAHCGLNKNNTCFKSDTFEGHADPVGEPGEPGETGLSICMSVPSSAVIGKLNGIAGYPGTDEDSEVTFKLPEDAVSKLLGNDTKFGKECIIMPTDIYKDVLNKDLEEHMKKYRDQVNQYMYYSHFLDAPGMNITPSTPSTAIPPVAKDYKEIGEHIHRKFAALIDAGFTEDQAMSLIPMWTDDEEN